MVENWIDFALNVVAGAAALLLLFEGTRRLGAFGMHRKAVLLFVLGLSVCGFYGGVAYQRYGALNATAAAAQRKAPAKPAPAAWSKVASPERREVLSQAVAQQTFKESGALRLFIDRNGETKTFAPSSEDLAARERVVGYYLRTEIGARNSLAEALLWLIGIVVAVVLGLAMSLDNKPPSRPAEEEPQAGA